jgi:hypothetical protein
MCGSTGRSVGVYVMCENRQRYIRNSLEWIPLLYYCRRCARKENRRRYKEHLTRKTGLRKPTTYTVGGRFVILDDSLNDARITLRKL